MYNRWLTPTGELYHHGVKGMKWGVRRERNKLNKRTKRDLMMISDYESHNKLSSLKGQYDSGQIDKKQYKSSKKQIKFDQKQAEKEIKRLKANKSLEEARKKFSETRNKAVSEIPNYELKRGVRTVNSLINGLQKGARVITVGALASGTIALGVVGGPAAAVAYAAPIAAGYGIISAEHAVDRTIRKKIIKSTA